MRSVVFWLCGLLWVLVFAGQALAQPYPSMDGRFEVSNTSGCVPFDIVVTIRPPVSCAPGCDVDLGDGEGWKSTNQTQTFTYDSAGTYRLRALMGTVIDEIEITVTENEQPNFEVYSCSNGGIEVALKDRTYDEYLIDYNDGTSEVALAGGSVAQHVYADTNPQVITVRGRNANAADNCDPAVATITPRAFLPPPIITRLEVLDNSRIRLQYDAEDHILYRLTIATNNATTFQQVKTVYNTRGDTVLNLATDRNYYCFRLEAYDPCSNTTVPSQVICSSRLNVEPVEKAMNVSWSTAELTPGTFLDLSIDDGVAIFVSRLDPPTSPFLDTGVICGSEYCYQLVITSPDGAQSVSAEKCAVGFSTEIPTEIRNISTIVSDNAVNLFWQNDPAFVPVEFSVEKSTAETYSLAGTTTQNAWEDDSFNPEEPSCYKVSYIDACGNQSPPSIPACPILLAGTLHDDNTVALSWTAYEGWADGVAQYTVEKYDSDGTLVQTFNAGTSTSFVDDIHAPEHQASIYVVRAYPVESGVETSASNFISILRKPNIFHPTAFTPNGDNLNDLFLVYGEYVSVFELMIFNRWGELLFVTNDINEGWDGTYKGDEMPEGTYTFVANITDDAGRTFKRSGSVLLLRK